MSGALERESTPDTRAAEPSPTTPSPALTPAGRAFLTDPGARSRFYAELRLALEAMVDEEMAGTAMTGRDCPWIAWYTGWFEARPVEDGQRFATIWLGAEASALPETDLRAAIVGRARAGVREWRSSGRTPRPLPGAPSPPELPEAPEGIAPIQRDAETAARVDLHPAQVLAHLGAGRPLDPGVRARLEPGLGGPLGDVRLHLDGAAADLAGRMGARAFTVGRHVAFAAGRYRPGTLPGDLLLAHELAHVRQQATAGPAAGSLERGADRAAVAAVARARGAAVSPPAPAPSGGLRLQRCGGSEGEIEDSEDVQWEGPRLVPPERTSSVPDVPDVPDLDVLRGVEDTSWSPVADDLMLAVRSENAMYLLPASRFVSEAPAPLSTAGPPDPTRGPVYGVASVGHGSLQLVNVGGGTGILIDAGGAGGANRLLLPRSLAALRQSLGVTRIDGVLLVHTHADHVRRLVELITSGAVSGNSVWIWPGWETATRGPWALVLAALRDPSMAARGFGPAWSPTPLTTSTIGATGSELTTSELRVGSATLSMVTRTADLQAYVSDLSSGGTGSRTADASSMLTRVREAGASHDMLIVGDLRGRTIGQIRAQMDAAGQPFADWVSRVRVITGFHHLGNVETGADAAGYRELLELLPTGGEVTVVAQADPTRVNTTFRQRLQAAGFRVVVVPNADPAAIRQFTVSQTGSVRAPGASVYEPAGAVAEANTRITRLRAAAEVLRNPEIAEPLLVTGGAAEARRLAGELDAEAQSLETAVRSRRALEMEGVHTGTRPADYTTRVTASDTALRTVGASERATGAETLSQLARMRPRVGELAELMAEVARTGESRPRLRELIAEVGPDVFREVLQRNRVSEMLPSAARSAALRRSMAELLQMRSLQRALQTGPRTVGMVGRGVAGLLVVVELVNAIGPYYAQARNARLSGQRAQMLRLLGALAWWGRLGLRPRCRFTAGGATLDDDAVGPAIVRRIWESMPPGDRGDLSALDQAVQDASPIDTVAIEPVASWPATFWALVVERLQSELGTWDDYSRLVEDDDAPGIRAPAAMDTGTWQVLTGTLDWSAGTDTVDWEDSSALTTAIRPRIAAVRTGTTAWLSTFAPPVPSYSEGPTIGPAREDLPSTSNRATFATGASRAVYSPYEAREVRDFSWSTPDPSFVLFRNTPAPAGLVWVTGADEATYRDIRRARVWRYDPDAVVQIQKPTLWERTYGDAVVMPTWYDWATSHGTPEERAAAQLVHAGAPGAEWYPYEGSDSTASTYYGEVRFPAWMPNTSGVILVRDELDTSGGAP